MKATELYTNRPLLRHWRSADREPFAAMNSDPLVMKYFASMLSRQESDALIERIEEHFDEYGFGLWAVEVPNDVPFLSFVGISIPRFQAISLPALKSVGALPPSIGIVVTPRRERAR